MKIAFLEPHLRVAGGIRRVLELGNELVRRGHQITYLLPSTEERHCDWMECLGRIEHIAFAFMEPFDVLVFNDEPQWSLVDRFKEVGLTVYYVLAYGVLYDKPGSRESYRFPVDLRLANSQWTADRIHEETGVRPAVMLGGVNRAHFRPVRVRKVYDVLTHGSPQPMKGTAEVEQACRELDVRLEKYEGKNLPQSKMAKEYCRARVFAVGSHFEGLGQQGLAALACGVLLPAPLLPTIPTTSPGPADSVMLRRAQNASSFRAEERVGSSFLTPRLTAPRVLAVTTARKLRGRWYRTRYFNQTSLRSKPGFSAKANLFPAASLVWGRQTLARTTPLH